MSLDNVLAVAAAGKGHLLLVALGVLISIPIIVAGSKLVLAILNRFPVVVLLGGALIGWIAGSMMVTDPTIVHLFPQRARCATAYGRRHRRGAGAAGRAARNRRHARPAERSPLTDAVNPDGVKFPPLSFPTSPHLPYAYN
jgi:hypothetical protein